MGPRILWFHVYEMFKNPIIACAADHVPMGIACVVYLYYNYFIHNGFLIDFCHFKFLPLLVCGLCMLVVFYVS